MTVLLKQLFNLIKALNSETGNYQLAAGMSFGILLGFAPFFSLQTLLVFLVVIFFRVQMGAAFLSAFFFKFIAYLVDPIADSLGRWVLEAPSMRSIFVSLYNMPIVPMTRFNNSIVMGSFIISLILVVPSFFIFNKLILKYRVVVVARFKNTKFWKAFQATKLYGLYSSYQKLYL